MGGGNWTKQKFQSYTLKKSMTLDSQTNRVIGNYSAQEMFKSRDLHPDLNPYEKIRECRETEEHPNVLPVILALDVTGSMGDGCVEVAKSLGTMMGSIYDKFSNERVTVQIMVMGIGDLKYDYSPLQVSQFESDIRIAEQLDLIYFEGGGGGNGFESYTAAWYYALNRCQIDCLNRGQKGIIITMGDEGMNPYLPEHELIKAIGIPEKVKDSDMNTEELYPRVIQSFDVYHFAIDSPLTSYRSYELNIASSFGNLLGERLSILSIEKIPDKIISIISDHIMNFKFRDGNEMNVINTVPTETPEEPDTEPQVWEIPTINF